MVIMAERFQSKEYEQAIMSDALKTRITNTCVGLDRIMEDGRAKSSRRKVRIAVVVLAALMIMTFSVYAASEWYYDVFSRLFGSGTGNAADVYSHPEVEVLTNTFEGVDIQVRGIAATDTTLYVLLDVVATDGTLFDTSDAGVGHVMHTGQGNEVFFSNPPRYSTYFLGIDPEADTRKEYNGISGWKSYNITASVLDIPDGDEKDNRMSVAWVEKSNLIKYPGSVILLSVNGISKDDALIKEGTWKVKLTVPEYQANVIEKDINSTTGMLRHEVFDYASPDSYVYDALEIHHVKLDTLGIEYSWTAQGDDQEQFLSSHTFHEWIEMKDGSIVGYPDITEASQNGDMFMRSVRQGGKQGITQKTFEKPIDVSNVKAIHIGRDLVIEVD